MKRWLTGILVLLFSVFCLYSCGSSKNKMANSFILDNPTEQALSVTLDGKSYSIAAGEFEKLTLKPGLHVLEQPDGEVINFRVTTHNTGGIINPSKSLHVVYGINYILEDSQSDGFIGLGLVLIDGVEYTGEIHTTNRIFIDNSVFLTSYTVGEPFPDVITTTDQDATNRSVRKFFTKEEFIDFYDTETQNPGYYESNKIPNGETTITALEQPRFPEYDFKDEQLRSIQENAKPIIDACQSASNEKELRTHLEDYYAILQELNNIRPEDKEEREKLNLFQKALSDAIQAGIVRVD